MDPSPAVRQLAEYLLRDVLAVKAPLLAYNHFVEALFVLNGCTAGLHGARLGANLGGGGGGAGTSLPAPGAEEGGGGGGQMEGAAAAGESGGQLAVAAPAQFTLKGRHLRCVGVCFVGRGLRDSRHLMGVVSSRGRGARCKVCWQPTQRVNSAVPAACVVMYNPCNVCPHKFPPIISIT